ncbi:MAG: outer membrane lipoprotein-sorting protein [Deltaproteobacteria bacterium]|nr:outer membrane lipoprotein-sorting protein [Deltaproteobacteria bacterium]
MRTLTLVLSLLLALPVLAADDPRALMDSVFDRGTWQDMKGKITLTLKTRRGDTKEREIEMWSRDNEAGEASMLMRFVAPADVKGTAFLQIENTGSADDRRLFLPALRRVQRITSSGTGGNFMASDFTFYDIGMAELDDWKFTFAGEGKTKLGACKKVEGKAAEERVITETGYSKVIWCVDSEKLTVLGTEYFDKDGDRFKQLTVQAFEELSGVPFATDMLMEDLSTGHSSRMLFSGLEVNTGVDPSLFTERALRKRR